MKILSAASEIYPLAKTGGLADVAGALPAALSAQGMAVKTLVPGYPAVMAALSDANQAHAYDALFGGKARIVSGKARGLDILALDAPHLYERPGNIYLGPDGRDWPDNAQRFAALAMAAADAARGAIASYRPDILHLHDWQAALAAVYVKFRGGPPTVLTVHNMAFQGQFPASFFGSLQLPPQAFAIDGVEYYGHVGFLKGGLATAGAITTVSPTYAREICTPEFGMGLDGLLKERRADLSGIVNGIDTDLWNPASDSSLAEGYTFKTLGRRAVNKRAVEKRLGLDEGDGILHGAVSRLTWQKGMDILAESLDWLVEQGHRLALIGTGEAQIEKAILSAVARHRGRIGAVLAYDESLSHLIQGGCDTILMPSRFEPCGLTQLHGLRYGCVPVVARTGGLSDTIIDANDAGLAADAATGFQFSPIDGPSLENALAQAGRLHRNRKAWSAMQKRGMETDVSWTRSAGAYAEIYRSLATSRAPA